MPKNNTQTKKLPKKKRTKQTKNKSLGKTWAFVFSFIGLMGFIGTVLIGNKYNPENHEARIETNSEGKKVLHWYQKIYITPSITSVPLSQTTPVSTEVANQQTNVSGLEQKYDIAVKAVNSENWQLAEDNLKSYVAIDPNRQTAFYLLGFVQNRRTKYDDAILTYKKYLALNPNNKYKFSAASELVYLLAKNKNCEEAVNELKNILFFQRKDAFSIDEHTGRMVRKAWLSALGCRALNAKNDRIAEKYMNWKKYLSSLSDDNYQSEMALADMPLEIKSN